MLKMRLQSSNLVLYLLLFFVVSLAHLPLRAQSVEQHIAYGETQSAIFTDTQAHHWQFEGKAREMLMIRVHRISGQFSPTLTLLNPDGQEIAISGDNVFEDTAELIFSDGLPSDGQYHLQISGENLLTNLIDNPDEYAITLLKTGQRKASIDDGLSIPLPNILNTLIPEILVGTPNIENPLQLPVYGDAVLDRPNPSTQPNLFTLIQGTQQIIIQNANPSPVNPVTVGIRFMPDGIGIAVSNDRLQERVPIFFTDQNFELSYDSPNRTWTFRLESEQSITTDFDRIEAILALENYVIVIFVQQGETQQKAIFDGKLINIRRRSVQSPSEAPITEFRLGEGRYLNSDLRGMETIAYLSGQLRVLYGTQARLMTDVVQIDALLETPSNSDSHTYRLVMQNPARNEPLTIAYDFVGMGDILVQENNVIISPLDGRHLTEPLATTRSILIEKTGVRFERANSSHIFRLSLPDGTEIETPAPSSGVDLALPHEMGYTPRGFNNLGENPIALCPCLTETLENTPVNPANGNFYYAVTDFAVPSHTLALNFTRYYNSLDAAGINDSLTPMYMLNAPHGYLLGQMGKGWRHSYQYELDLTTAPLDTITLIMPDGARHLFNAQTPGNPRFVSSTLVSWAVERTDGILGTWHATRTDGIQYQFDRAGRLQRIIETPQRSLNFIPAPLSYADENNGFFVIEPYGRRLEIYISASGNIEVVRDTFLREITYTHASNYLIDVQYIHPDYKATYTYNEAELLETYDDVRSADTQRGRLGYDERSRIIFYVQNPGENEREYRYEYNDTSLTTRQNQTIAGTDHQWTWIYDSRWRLITKRPPGNNPEEGLAYNGTSNILQSYTHPNKGLFSFKFDEKGKLIELDDPIYDPYVLTYEQRGEIRLLTRIQGLANQEEIFTYTYDLHMLPRLQTHRRLVQVGNNTGSTAPLYQETRYEYDAWGRVILIVAPGTTTDSGIGTVYHYDVFGYPKEIWQGIIVTPEKTAADITADQAQRILKFQYDILGQLRAVTDGRGALFTLNYDPYTGKLREIAAPQGVRMTYQYDVRGNLIEQNDRGQITQYAYNAFDNLIAMIDANNGRTHYNYDEANRLIKIEDAVGRIIAYQYDVLDNLTEFISPSGLRTIFTTSIDIASTRTLRQAFLPDGSNILWRYDALDRLRLVEINKEGVRQDFTIDYNPAGLPITIQSGFLGRTLALNYNAAGWLTTTTIEGLTTRYEYDLAGRLIRVIPPGEHITEIQYDALGNVTHIDYPTLATTESGNQLTLAYDAENNLISTTNAAGLMTHYVYDALNQLISTTDAGGDTTEYHYDVRGNLIRLLDPMGHERTWIYDGLDQLTAASNGLYQSQYTYDAIGRLLFVTEPEGFTAQGRTLRLSYDLEGNVIASNITPGQLRTLYTYDLLGRLTSITDPKGHTTVYTYNRSNKPSQIIDALGNTQQYTWRNGTLETYTDAEGNKYQYSQDEFGRLTRITDNTGEMPAVQNTDFTYSPDGYLTEIVIRPQGVTNSDQAIRHRYQYDNHGNPIRYIDPRGSQWHFEYDSIGRRTATIDPAGSITRYIYNNSGQIIEVIRYADTEQQTIDQYEYDANGNITRYISPLGIVHTYDYNTNQQVIRAVLASGTDAEAVYQLMYNGQGQLIQSDDPHQLRTCYFYRLDKLRRIEVRLTNDAVPCDRAVTDEEKIQYSYEYDNAGNLVSIILPAVEGESAVINLAYDALNRRVRYVDPVANVWSYTYDRINNLRQLSDPSGNSTAYEYNSYRQITQVIFPTFAEVAFGYDNNGNINTLRLPLAENQNNRQTLTYVLDTLGNLLEIREGSTLIRRFEYDARGQVILRQEANGHVTCYTYDAAGRLSTTTYQTQLPCGSGSGEETQYHYDAVGNLIQVQPANDDVITMTYDAHNQLKTFEKGGIALHYDYDAIGNLMIRDAGAAGTIQYTYDALYRLIGIQQGDAAATLTYDNRRRLTELTRSNGVVTRYTYDAAGHVISLIHLNAESVPLDGFVYQYDGAGNLIGADRVTDDWRVLYSYDVMNRLIDERWLNARGETVYTFSMRYDAAGNRTEVIRNGIITRYIYNEKNQLITAIKSSGLDITGQASAGFIILAGTLSLLPVVRRRMRSGIVLLLTLSATMPLVAQTPPDILQVEYAYDAAGNLLSMDYRYEQPRFDANGSLMTAADGTLLTEEASYRLVFEYDAEQRLIAVTGQNELGNPVALRLDYDPVFSQPTTWFSGDAGSYRLYYDGTTPLTMENTSQGSSTEHYLHLSPQVRLLTITEAGDYIWHLNDVTNTPRRFVNNNGELLDTPDRVLEFNGFGERIYPYPDYPQTPESAVQQVMPLFAGQLFDPATGYYVMGLRVYDPETARFIQPDPVRQDIYGTLYTYAQNRSPVLYDPSGMSAEPYLEPTQILPFTAQLHPETLIPQPYEPEIWLPPTTTASAQADEFFRVWQLFDLTYYGVNDATMQLSAGLEDLYIAKLNIMPMSAKEKSAQNLRNIMALYTPGQGWAESLTPQPHIPSNPYAILEDVVPLLAQTQQYPLAFCEDDFYSYEALLPQINLPLAYSPQWQLQMELLNALQPVSLVDGLLPEIENLGQLPDETLLISPPPLGSITPPEAAIEPPLLTELAALRDQQRAFLERILNTQLAPRD